MEISFNTNNKKNYAQVLISFLIILFIFVPFVENFNGGTADLPAITSFSLFFCGESQITKETHTAIGVCFVIFILLQLVNIFVQSKKSVNIYAIATALFGIIPLILLNNYIADVESEANSGIREYNERVSYYGGDNYLEEVEIEYEWGFYVIIVLMAMQVIIPFISSLIQISYQSNPEPTTLSPNTTQHEITPAMDCKADIKPLSSQLEPDGELAALRAEAEALRAEQARIKADEERAEKERLEEEFRRLKAQAELLEKERLEKEKQEKERLEKENLKNEIAKLKELLERQKNNPESNL